MKLKNLLIAFLAIFLASCTSNNDFEKAKKQLKSQGYINIRKTGYKMWCCSDEDTFKTGFIAISSDGDTVEGGACSSFLKGVTIRFK